MVKNLIISSILISITLGCGGSKSLSNLFKKKPSNPIELKLDAEQTTLRLSENEFAEIKVSINNFTDDTLHLVQPGDGSEVGWRTPIVRWSVINLSTEEPHPADFPAPQTGLTRCGNVNAVKLKEIIRLRPERSVQLNAWVGHPPIPREAGKYSVKFYYKNDPALQWEGISAHDENILEMIRTQTDDIVLRSNELIISVKN